MIQDFGTELVYSYDPNRSMEIVFKIQETCNINCRYCYMYNLGNELYKEMPTQTTLDVCRGVARFICTEFLYRNPRSINIILHGGEPMLMSPKQMVTRLNTMFEILRGSLSEKQMATITISLQSNATLVSEEWLALLRDWKINVGVSIDGPQETHDQRRVDKFGKGTHADVVLGVRRLQAAKNEGISLPGALCVIDPQASGRHVYAHLTKEMHFTGFDFLLPFMSWDNFQQSTLDGVSRFLTDAFAAWREDYISGTSPRVRIFSNAMKALQGRFMNAKENRMIFGHDIVIVESDGTIMPDESLRPTYNGRFTKLNIQTHNLTDIQEHEVFKTVTRKTYNVPNECNGCALLNPCWGGAALGRAGSRYSSENITLRKSVYCEAFIELFIDVSAFLAEKKIWDNASMRARDAKVTAKLERSEINV